MVYYHKSECRPETELRQIHNDSHSNISFDRWLELRDRCRKDLFFLLTKVLGWTRIIERVHKPVCDFFPKLNFDDVYHDAYTLEEVQEALKRQCPTSAEYLLLDPRGAFKSTIDSGFCVQVLLNAPDLRIFIITGEHENAIAFLTQIKKYFFLADADAPLNMLQQLFPEYILRTADGGDNKTALNCPARIHTEQKEPSLWVNGIGATLASKHCDIFVGDDVISDKNSTTPEARKSLKDKYDNAQNLLDEWGILINIGTRYAGGADPDWYGARIAIKDEAPLNYFCRAAWKPKPGKERIPLRDLKEEDVELLFPEKLAYKVLRKKLLNNEKDFRNQQLNDPTNDAGAIQFTEDTLRECLQQSTKVPPSCDVVIAWDWAPTSSMNSDYSAGAVGAIDRNTLELHVLEIEYGRWKSSTLAEKIVYLAKRHQPRCILIEKAPGSDLLQQEIQRLAMRLHVSMPIMWQTPDNSSDAKANRVKGVETLVNERRIKFVQGPWIDETFAQFIRFTGERKNRGRKDDIPDAVSMLTHFLPKEAKQPTKVLNHEELEEIRRQAEMSYQKEAFDRFLRDRVFPAERMAERPPTVETVSQPEKRGRFDFRPRGF